MERSVTSIPSLHGGEVKIPIEGDEQKDDNGRVFIWTKTFDGSVSTFEWVERKGVEINWGNIEPMSY